jgi:hypothetical protein
VSSVARYSPYSNDVSTGSLRIPLLQAVVRERPLDTLQARGDLACFDL